MSGDLDPQWPVDTRCLVTVTFVDGEVQVYPTSAHAGISGHLTQQMANGAVDLFVRGKAVCIPSSQIRTLEVEQIQ